VFPQLCWLFRAWPNLNQTSREVRSRKMEALPASFEAYLKRSR
jgi:hypothetical protein